MYKTQYIAPLRVKLDPARSDDATINYLSQPDRDADMLKSQNGQSSYEERMKNQIL